MDVTADGSRPLPIDYARARAGASRPLSPGAPAAANGTRCPLVGTLPGLEDDEINATTVPAAMVSDLLALFDLLMVVSLCLKFLNFLCKELIATPYGLL